MKNIISVFICSLLIMGSCTPRKTGKQFLEENKSYIQNFNIKLNNCAQQLINDNVILDSLENYGALDTVLLFAETGGIKGNTYFINIEQIGNPNYFDEHRDEMKITFVNLTLSTAQEMLEENYFGSVVLDGSVNNNVIVNYVNDIKKVKYLGVVNKDFVLNPEFEDGLFSPGIVQFTCYIFDFSAEKVIDYFSFFSMNDENVYVQENSEDRSLQGNIEKNARIQLKDIFTNKGGEFIEYD